MIAISGTVKIILARLKISYTVFLTSTGSFGLTCSNVENELFELILKTVIQLHLVLIVVKRDINNEFIIYCLYDSVRTME